MEDDQTERNCEGKRSVNARSPRDGNWAGKQLCTSLASALEFSQREHVHVHGSVDVAAPPSCVHDELVLPDCAPNPLQAWRRVDPHVSLRMPDYRLGSPREMDFVELLEI